MAGALHYQEVLRGLIGVQTKVYLVADLIPHPDNEHDPNAIGVWVGGSQIGWVPTANTATFHEVIAAEFSLRLPVQLCTAPPRLTNVWVDIDIRTLNEQKPSGT